MVSTGLLLVELRRRGIDVRVVAHGSGTTSAYLSDLGIPVETIPAPGTRAETDRADGFSIGNVISSMRAYRFLAQYPDAIIHTNDKRMLRTWALPLRLRGIPLIAHWRSVYRPSRSIDVGLKIARVIVPISDYSLRKLPTWAQAKASVVMNPFQLPDGDDLSENARQTMRSRLGLEGARVIGYFGSMIERKRPSMLLDILDRVPADHAGTPVKGLCCGETLHPPDMRYLQEAPKFIASGRLVAPGRVSDPLRYMAACDVIVVPSIGEPFGRIGIEAQSVGVPAIISADSGLKEVITHEVTGCVLDPNDLDAWVASVRRILDDKDFAEKLRRNGREAAETFNVERHTDQVEAVYREVFAGRSTRLAQAQS